MFWIRLRQWKQKNNRNSLQSRLTVGIVLVSVLSLGSVTLWTGRKMQTILVDTYKKNIQYVSERFPSVVEHYAKGETAKTGLQPAIESMSADNILLWVTGEDGKLIEQSAVLQGHKDNIRGELTQSVKQPGLAQVFQVEGRYYVACREPLRVKGLDMGKLYVAQDITPHQTMLIAMTRSLNFASFLALVGMSIAIAIYVKQSLQPLQRLSNITQKISPEALKEAQMDLKKAPTEVRDMAETCEKMLVHLANSWENQRQFVSNVSHELRTPLTIIRGYLQSTLRRGDNLSEPQREALEIASTEAERTITMLQDLLDLARADSGYLHFYVENISLNELLKELASMAKQYSQREIVCSPGQSEIVAKGDRNRLKQVLLNLINNAIAYSDRDQPITLQLESNQNHALIRVCDRGVGIPLDQQTRIFDRFYRGDEARSRSVGGTGLGLSIVKTLVEGMEGTVSVRSTPGQGSTFTISLPIVRTQQETMGRGEIGKKEN
jgi:signal transduction histidine kinase